MTGPIGEVELDGPTVSDYWLAKDRREAAAAERREARRKLALPMLRSGFPAHLFAALVKSSAARRRAAITHPGKRGRS